MAVEATIVLEFGDGAPSDALVIVELDDVVNKNTDGSDKTSFSLNDKPGFIVHYDTSALRIGSVKASSGMIVDSGNVSRSRTAQISLSSVNNKQTLSYIPSGGVNWKWYGNVANISQSIRELIATGGSIPAIGDISFSINARAYLLYPPTISGGLRPDETWPILVVIYMEGVG